ncbi:MAG TPA: transcriptional repressor [Thermodesulfovibrionales bacterium]|jgi:Fur family ferric uptake transcriptional regulator|nr:transcriptional repressor [Thermodesulfovibrionales bacterium]
MSANNAKDIFRNCIIEKGLRNTRQREVILDAFLSANKHITVEELFNAVKKKHPEIGYATVHRNLSLFCECGLADEIKIGKQKTRYEQKVGHEHHDHLVCLKCGQFIEVHDEKIEKLQNKLAEANDFIPMRHKLEIYGMCSKCR